MVKRRLVSLAKPVPASAGATQCGGLTDVVVVDVGDQDPLDVGHVGIKERQTVLDRLQRQWRVPSRIDQGDPGVTLDHVDVDGLQGVVGQGDRHPDHFGRNGLNVRIAPSHSGSLPQTISRVSSGCETRPVRLIVLGLV